MNAHVSNSAALIDPALLALLLDADVPLTVEALALRRGLPSEQVWHELERLRAAGCRFDEHPQHGVRLVETGLGAWVDYLRDVLGAQRWIEVYKRTGSTQDVCRRLVEAHGAASAGALVIADEQTSGRGRLGRRWVAPAGTAATFSQIHLLNPASQGASVDRLTLATATAVASAVETMLGGRRTVQLKWPNDVYIEGRKLAGILVETFDGPSGTRAAIIGVGLNVNLSPRDLPEDDDRAPHRMTSLAMEAAPTDRLTALAHMTAEIDAALGQSDATALLEGWRRRSAMLHQSIRVRSDGRLIEGEAIDLDPQRGLIVRTASGEIVHLPAATTTVV